jgi:hypothetical protein
MVVASSVNELDHFKIFDTDLKLGDWVWCLHCERVYRYGEYRPVSSAEFGNLQLCPFDDCDGSPFDLVEWEWVRESNPDYPVVPVWGEWYPLYGVVCESLASD